jgi:spermidine synthase
MDTDPDRNWHNEKISENLAYRNRIEKVLYEGKTKYQSVKVLRCYELGVCLVLDDKLQSCERDEFIYHEGLVQPAMITHPVPETVFIAGGGEGATLREVLRHQSVKKAVMVDIDGEVTALSKKYLPGYAQGAFEDERAEVHHTDARIFLEKSQDKYDVMIIDLPDPIEEGPAYLLFTQEFYKIALEHMTAGGIMSVQAGATALTELLNFTAVNNTLKSIFPISAGCTINVPCFGVPWGFSVASLKHDPTQLTAAEVDKRIKARKLTGFKFYDGITHRGMFSLPLYTREALAAQKRVITDKKPLYLYKG